MPMLGVHNSFEATCHGKPCQAPQLKRYDNVNDRFWPRADCFRMLGIPRVFLALVSWRTQAAARGHTAVFSWNLPYEIVVVGMYDSKCEVD